MAAACLWLGTWQLGRATEKAAARDMAAVQAARPAVGLQDLLAPAVDVADLEFRRVRVAGEYEAAGTVLLDNRVHGGRAGYEVITPLRIADDSPRILVDRGWIPWGPDRARLPDVSPPAGRVEISGALRRPPSPGLRLGADDTGGPVRAFLDIGDYRSGVPFAVHPLVLLMDPGVGAGGFARDWAGYNDDSWITRHRAYAFQWFALAAIVIALLLRSGLKRFRRNRLRHP